MAILSPGQIIKSNFAKFTAFLKIKRIINIVEKVDESWEKTAGQLAFLTTDIFASFGVLPLLHLRAYTLQDATVYTCSYLYSGNFIISTVKSRYSRCFNCLKL